MAADFRDFSHPPARPGRLAHHGVPLADGLCRCAAVTLDDCFLGRKTRIGGRCVLVLYCRVSLRISLRLADVARDEGQDTRRGGHKVESELCTAAACVRPQSGQIRPKNVGGMLARTPSFSSVASPTSPPFTLCPPWLHAPRRDFFPCFFGRRNAGAGQMVATAFR